MLENRSLLGEGVQIRGGAAQAAVTAQAVPAMSIQDHQDDIGFPISRMHAYHPTAR
jgi:hypothetical protein